MASREKAFNHERESYHDLKKYPRSRSTFKKTKAFEEVLELVEHHVILHLHGMSGSGKSQTLAGTCEKLDENPARIIWHVQCGERSGALKREWKELIVRLREKKMISSETECGLGAAIRDNVEGYLHIEMKKFINELNSKLSLPMLLVVEDIEHDDEKRVIRTLVSCMKEFIKDVLKIKLLIATQDKHAIYPILELEDIDIYRTYHVRGFSEMEAFDFLCTVEIQMTDKNKVKKLAEELAYSPLGLFVAKSYCMKYKLSYEYYYDSLKNEDIKRQKSMMEQDIELRRKNHRYDIIAKLLAPKHPVDEEERIERQVTLMISFVSNEHIPTQMIKRFFSAAGQTTSTEQHRLTKVLIERLKREVDAVTWEKGDGEMSLVIHSDVLRALRRSMKPEQKTDVLADVVTALASILDKDNRVTETYMLLHDLKNHAEAVANNCLEHFDELLHKPVVPPKDCQILLGLSKINEVIGFSNCQHQGMREGFEEDDYYQRALVCIWTIVCSNTSSSLWSSLRSKFKGKEQQSADMELLIDYGEKKDPASTAEEAYKRIEDASLANDEIKKILQNDSEKSYPVKKKHFSEMKQRLGDRSGVDWMKLEKEIDENGCLSLKSKKLLQEKKMLLGWDQLNEFYLAEKIASILHSRGRLDNYKGDIIPPEMHVRCSWYVDLGLALCDIIFQKTGVKSLFRFLLKSNNVLSRLTRNRENETDEEFIQRINKCRDMARHFMQEKSDFYEHGVYKHVERTAWTLMKAGKHLMKANTKVYKRPHLLQRLQSKTADKECEELVEICKNNPKIKISATCLIYAAKYSAASGRYSRAIEMFQLAFKQGIEKALQVDPSTYAWALFNLGRAITAAGCSMDRRETVVKDFRRRYELTKSNKTPDKWRKILDGLYEEVHM